MKKYVLSLHLRGKRIQVHLYNSVHIGHNWTATPDHRIFSKGKPQLCITDFSFLRITLIADCVSFALVIDDPSKSSDQIKSCTSLIIHRPNQVCSQYVSSTSYDSDVDSSIRFGWYLLYPTGRISSFAEQVKKPSDLEGFFGERRIRTFEGVANRFTVCPLWPLGNLPISVTET